MKYRNDSEGKYRNYSKHKYKSHSRGNDKSGPKEINRSGSKGIYRSRWALMGGIRAYRHCTLDLRVVYRCIHTSGIIDTYIDGIHIRHQAHPAS